MSQARSRVTSLWPCVSVVTGMVAAVLTSPCTTCTGSFVTLSTGSFVTLSIDLQGDHITADLCPVSTVALGHCLHGHHLGQVGGVERLPVGRHPAPPALLAVELQTVLQYFSFYTTKSMMWRPAISRVMKNIFHPDNRKYLNSLPLGTYRRGVCRERRRKHSAAYSGTPLRGRPLPARTPR